MSYFFVLNSDSMASHTNIMLLSFGLALKTLQQNAAGFSSAAKLSFENVSVDVDNVNKGNIQNCFCI
jgi:ubiquitin C-terminal hydrolase